MIYDLVPDSDPVLHQPLSEFDFSNPPIDPVQLASDLFDTMQVNGGIGLAANQCGFPHRVFVMLAQNGVPFAAFNPEITEASGQQTGQEGCLSFPRLVLNVKRSAVVTLKARNERGVEFETILAGRQAVCAQHELDHLNGIDFTQRVSKLKLEMARKKAR